MVRNLTTGESRVISKGGTYARFAPDDRVVFIRGGTLFVAGFDPNAVASERIRSRSSFRSDGSGQRKWVVRPGP